MQREENKEPAQLYHAGWIALEPGLEGQVGAQPSLKAAAQPQWQDGKAERWIEAPVWGFQQALA